MAASEPVEDAAEAVVVRVVMRNGASRVALIPDTTMRDMHAEIDDAFVQRSYLMLETAKGVTYVNPAEIAFVEVQTEDEWSKYA